MALGDSDSGGFGGGYGLGGGFGNDSSMGGGTGLGTGGGLGFGSSGGYGFGSGSGGQTSYGGGGGGSGYGLTDGNYFDFGYTGYSPSTSFNLGDVYSQSSGLGFNPTGDLGLSLPSSPSSPSYTGVGLVGEEKEQSFLESSLGKFLKSVGLFAANMTPVGRAATLGYNAYNALQSGNYGQLAGGLVGAATGNGLLGTAVGLGTDAAMGKDVSKQAARAGIGTLGSMVGGSIAGPIGAFAGGQLGAMAAGYNGTSGPAPTTRGDGGGNLAGQLAAGLGQLYLNNKAAKEASGNVQNLNQMFGPNSAYAQQMRKELERRDAAAGRRSQYGPREVELQAKLAQMAAQYGPNISQANNQSQAIAQQRRAQTLNSLYAMAKESGLLSKANDLFQTPSPRMDYSLPSTGSSYGFQPSGSYGLQPPSSGGGLYDLWS